MKTFSQFHQEIEGYQDVKKTVEAEEKISIGNVHLFLKKSEQLRMYTKTIEDMLSKFLFFNGGEPYSIKHRSSKKVLIVLGGNKGLVRGLWNELIDYLNDQYDNYQQVIIYGKAIDKKMNMKISYKLDSRFSFYPFPPVKQIFSFSKDLLKFIRQEDYLSIDIIWPKMINFNYFQPSKKNIIPFEAENELKIKGKQYQEEKNDLTWPIFEPNGNKIFNAIVDRYLSTSIYQIIIETKLAESLSRATSMEKAKKEVDKLINNMIHSFRSERKKILTKNQIEVFVAHKVVGKS